ncbi:unnamed protein product [Natator depressus]
MRALPLLALGCAKLWPWLLSLCVCVFPCLLGISLSNVTAHFAIGRGEGRVNALHCPFAASTLILFPPTFPGGTFLPKQTPMPQDGHQMWGSSCSQGWRHSKLPVRTSGLSFVLAKSAPPKLSGAALCTDSQLLSAFSQLLAL